MFDLVLVDLQIPPGRWGGLKLISGAGSLVNEVPFVVVSGAGSLTECIEAMRMGAVDYVTKERCQTDLLPAIKNALAKHGEQGAVSDYSIVREVERKLHRIVLTLLSADLPGTGHDDVFRAFFSVSTSVKCYQRMLESGGNKQEEFLDLIDFREVIDKQWTNIAGFRRLEQILRPKTKDQRTRWLVELNDFRKVVAHPVRGTLGEGERRRLKEIRSIVRRWSDACDAREE